LDTALKGEPKGTRFSATESPGMGGLPVTMSRVEFVFPTLTQAQLQRVAARGRTRAIARGDVLIEPGDLPVPFLVVSRGQLETVRLGSAGEAVLAVSEAGQFTGEIGTLTGRRAMFRVRASKGGEVIELDRRQMLALVQTDAELGEILMRAFVLRRAELVASGTSDAVLIGSAHSAATLRIKEFLVRNGYPHAYIDLDRDPGAQTLLDGFHVGVADVPVLVCRNQIILRNPTNQQVAECLGLNDPIDPAQIRDLVVIGAGPSGLASAVYGASEGLDVLVLETSAPGGQAGSSSRIENYLGFPTGISGQELAAAAYSQAEKFGAQVLIASGVRLSCDRKPYAVELDNGTRIQARAIVIASGAEYRKLPLENLAQFEGAGIYYGATFVEAQLCEGEEAIVVGGGNSAGQAAVFLAQRASRVHVLVRSGGLAESMSRYLIRRIEETPTIVLHPYTEIAALEGGEHLESVTWRDNQTGEAERHAIRHVFLMTGGAPNTKWIDGCVVLDDNGFVKTGPDLAPEDLSAAHWPLARRPFLLESSLPGVFAVGDVRAGSVKRVASAVGEGSISVSFVHQVLRD
jgi:thioredoxin reductase (NADPH)